MSGYYNGYSARERAAKYRQLMKAVNISEFPASSGPCEMCGDPDVATEYHSEDYSFPYEFTEFSLCRSCHRSWFHKRFSKPLAWKAFKAHIRRGGYASDIKQPKIHKQVTAYQKALDEGKKIELPFLRDRVLTGEEWWEHVHLDPASLEAFDARVRANQDILTALEMTLPNLSETQIQILVTHYNMPAHTISMSTLANHLGYTDGKVMNSQYGKLARLLLDGVPYDPPKREDGSQKLMMVICHASSKKSSAGEFQWVMNHSFAWAMEQLKIKGLSNE